VAKALRKTGAAEKREMIETIIYLNTVFELVIFVWSIIKQ
jgi:hypothetical protein